MKPATQPQEYEPPAIVDYGDLADLTAGQTNGHELDSAFHVGKSHDHRTFSNA